MTDYIKREDAVEAAQAGADEWDGGYNINRDAYIECAIDKIPAADVVPWEWLEKYADGKRMNYASGFVHEAKEAYKNG